MSQSRAARLDHTTPRLDALGLCSAPRRCPLPSRYRFALVLCCGLRSLLSSVAPAADCPTARVAVSVAPHGGATDAVVHEVHAAADPILVQAYSFTSAPIAKALIDAHTRRVQVLAVLDTSKGYRVQSGQDSAGMRVASVVPFATEGEAQQAGYRRAKDCP